MSMSQLITMIVGMLWPDNWDQSEETPDQIVDLADILRPIISALTSNGWTFRAVIESPIIRDFASDYRKNLLDVTAGENNPYGSHDCYQGCPCWGESNDDFMPEVFDVLLPQWADEDQAIATLDARDAEALQGYTAGDLHRPITWRQEWAMTQSINRAKHRLGCLVSI